MHIPLTFLPDSWQARANKYMTVRAGFGVKFKDLIAIIAKTITSLHVQALCEHIPARTQAS